MIGNEVAVERSGKKSLCWIGCWDFCLLGLPGVSDHELGGKYAAGLAAIRHCVRIGTARSADS
jgi:hypothetical protein